MPSEGSGVDVECSNDDCDYETVAFAADTDAGIEKIRCGLPSALPWCPECGGERYLLHPTSEVGDA